MVAALAAAALGLAVLIAGSVLELVPHVTDAVSYLFQGRILASGRLYEPPPAVPALFAQENVLLTPTRWCSKYPPGWPLLLALGWRLHAPWLMSPLLLALAVAGVWLAGRRLYDPATGLLAAAALACSPFALLMAADAMAHVPALCASAWCLAMLAGAIGDAGANKDGKGKDAAQENGAAGADGSTASPSAFEPAGPEGGPVPSPPAAGPASTAAIGIPAIARSGGLHATPGTRGTAGDCGRRRRRRLLAAGLLGGFALLIRPLTALTLLAPAVAWCGVALWRRRRLADLAWMAAGAAPCLAVLAAYNTVVFGGPLTSGYAVAEPARFGGSGGAALVPLGVALLHSLPWYLRRLNQCLWGFPWGDMVLLAPVLWARPRRAADAMLAACAACLIVAHSFYFYGDVIYSGPRFAFESLGPLSLLAARSLRTLGGWLAAAGDQRERLERLGGRLGAPARRALRLAAAGAAGCLLLYFPLARRLPEQMLHHAGWYLAVSAAPLRAAVRAGVGPEALVFVAGTPWCYSIFFLTNDPPPGTSRRVFVRDIPPLRAAALAAYPRAEVWVARVEVVIPHPRTDPDVAKPTALSWTRLR
jgi:hypothetical protein